ncbi:BatD family protein [Coraliomargarita algicola]|uniref:BatD family protein n=1 Tax=Coraliomargarita algicola TaxID=3092156 RepID=A0ABZ0RHK0_9BACT|nr:BatD family protein [Coraliomargarita sp. J2-16]WPJ95669.1 BatD family protein [Coraliomargarita sp. J2-16]
MPRYFIIVFSLLALSLSAQESEPQLPLQHVQAQAREQSFFTDRIASLRVDFDSVVDTPEDWPQQSDGFRILDIEVQATQSEPAGSQARIRFLPTKAGVVTLPAFDFQSASTHYQTAPIQIIVSEPQRSDQMSLQLTPHKLKVYVGEPLRIDLVWHSSINAAALKHLKLFPDYFNDPNISIVIPRSTAAEEVQVGLPIGGRRVIATRTRLEGNEKALGTIELPIFLRFEQAGKYTLPTTHLECALLEKPDQGFARYAAHFNNSFFTPVEPSERYRRIYTTAPAIDIEVLPLPIDSEQATFTGLFEPISIQASASPTELEIGQLMELEFKVSSSAPHGMLQLPPLSQQSGLRERFVVDDQYRTLWQADGSLFRTRLRPLATSTQAIPSLYFRTFNPETGSYQSIRTQAIPLHLKPSNGLDFIPHGTFEGAAVRLSSQTQGIWNNLEKNPMNDTLNLITQWLNQLFWPLLCLGPILFLILLPVVRERRRRALNPDYARRVAAYKSFKKIPRHAPEKWPAFLQFMATTFGSQSQAWTRGDSEQALQKIGADTATQQALQQIHDVTDAAEFSRQAPKPEYKNLNQIAQTIARHTGKLSLLLCLLTLGLSPQSKANEWSEAQQSFAQAQAAPVGSDASIAAYTVAALKFENLATTHRHGAEAWVNAGNAWYQAGELGRAIVAYRSAQAQRPFDSQLAASLASARASALNTVPDSRSYLQKIPTTWLKISCLILNTLFWGSLLVMLRYPRRSTYISSSLLAMCLLISASYLSHRILQSPPSGTIIVDSIYAKKGPGYAYANAFNEPLHDGLECTLIETRADWHHIQLNDQRSCWVPPNTLQLIQAD